MLQETLCRALANREQYTANTNIKGWLFTIMRNTYINNYRRRTRTIPFYLHFEGYKYQEIADLIDITLGTIKSRIHLARKLLRQQISRETIRLN